MSTVWVVTHGEYDSVVICVFTTQDAAQHYVDLRNMEESGHFIEEVPLNPPITFSKWALTPEEAEAQLKQQQEQKARQDAEDAAREATRIENMRKWEAQERKEGRMK